MATCRTLLLSLCVFTQLSALPAVQALPLAAGRAKFLGGIHSSAQAPNLLSYFNQVTPENGGKWGAVESSRNVMNWGQLDAAYALAKDNGLPFKMHTLLWGSQQPSWISGLSAADQLTEIKEWMAAVAARYPDIDTIDVVNEPLRSPPDGSTSPYSTTPFVNYIGALGGKGTSGWEWVLTSFRLARTYFPRSKLLLNEYSVTNDGNAAQRYLTLINLLKAENLLDGIGIQAHAFETTVANSVTKTNLDLIATSGLPIYISEMDVDGPTDQTQVDNYQRLFPLFWEHPAVVGITLWGYRPGLWRDEQGAALVRADGSEKPAMTWLKSYLNVNAAPVVATEQNFYVSESAGAGANVGVVRATDADGYGTLRDWRITGGTGAALFAINSTTGQLTVAAPASLNATTLPTCTLAITVSDGRDTSVAQTVTVNVRAASVSASRLVNISTRAYCTTENGVTIGGFVITGAADKRVLLRAVGPSLATQGIGTNELLRDPTIEVHRGSPVIARNDNWGDNAAEAAEIVSVAARVGARALDADDTTSSAVILTLSPGVYSFIVRGKGDTSGIVLIEAYDADGGSPGSVFVNIATRGASAKGNGVAIGGFVIEGTVPKQVLMRAVGSTLTTQGLGFAEVLADPAIELHHGSPIIAENNNWAASANANPAAITATAARIGATALAFPDTKSSALLLTLPAGAYSFIARGTSDTTGIVLVEVYDAD